MKAARLLPLAAGFCVACGSDTKPELVTLCDLPARSITVSPATVTMTVGDSALLAASPPQPGPCVAPLSVPFAVFWRSSNPAVVTVDSTTGKTRGVGAGATTVLAIIVGDTAEKGAAAVQVNAR
jgi:uncharacterized protein YjdB